MSKGNELAGGHTSRKEPGQDLSLFALMDLSPTNYKLCEAEVQVMRPVSP